MLGLSGEGGDQERAPPRLASNRWNAPCPQRTPRPRAPALAVAAVAAVAAALPLAPIAPLSPTPLSGEAFSRWLVPRPLSKPPLELLPSALPPSAPSAPSAPLCRSRRTRRTPGTGLGRSS